MIETWVDLPEYSDYYWISNFGNVKKKINGRILKARQHSGGYNYVQLSINGKETNITLHRFIAKAFISNPENKPYINHRDGNKLNNTIDNLEWTTASENQIHAFATGLQKPLLGELHQNSILKESQVLEIRNLFNTKSTREIAAIYNVSVGCIGNIKRGVTWRWL
jgi:hypothetical protein